MTHKTKYLTLLIMIILLFFTGCAMNNEEELSSEEKYLQDKGVDLDGEGTSSSPYLIKNAKDFYQIKQNPSGHYKLANNIDLNSDYYKEENGLFFFGYESVLLFAGVLDGDGHTLIYKGDITKPLFMNLKGAKITNLILDWEVTNLEANMEMFSSISNSYSYAIIANNNYNSVINNIDFNAILDISIKKFKYSPYRRNISIIAGANYGEITNINGYANVKFEGQNKSSWESHINFGSIAGFNQGLIKDINVTNDLNINTSKAVHELRVGGISGYNNGRIVNCIVSSQITAMSSKNDAMNDGSVSCGGVTGINAGFGIIKDVYTYNNDLDCYSMSFTYSAGIAGENNGAISNTFSLGVYKASGYWSSFISNPKTGLILAAGSADEVTNNVVYSVSKSNIYGVNGNLDKNILLSNSDDLNKFKEINKTNNYFLDTINWDNNNFRLVLDTKYWSYDPINEKYTLLLAGESNE